VFTFAIGCTKQQSVSAVKLGGSTVIRQSSRHKER